MVVKKWKSHIFEYVWGVIENRKKWFWFVCSPELERELMVNDVTSPTKLGLALEEINFEDGELEYKRFRQYINGKWITGFKFTSKDFKKEEKMEFSFKEEEKMEMFFEIISFEGISFEELSSGRGNEENFHKLIIVESKYRENFQKDFPNSKVIGTNLMIIWEAVQSLMFSKLGRAIQRRLLLEEDNHPIELDITYCQPILRLPSASHLYIINELRKIHQQKNHNLKNHIKIEEKENERETNRILKEFSSSMGGEFKKQFNEEAGCDKENIIEKNIEPSIFKYNWSRIENRKQWFWFVSSPELIDGLIIDGVNSPTKLGLALKEINLDGKVELEYKRFQQYINGKWSTGFKFTNKDFKEEEKMEISFEEISFEEISFDRKNEENFRNLRIVENKYKENLQKVYPKSKVIGTNLMIIREAVESLVFSELGRAIQRRLFLTNEMIDFEIMDGQPILRLPSTSHLYIINELRKIHQQKSHSLKNHIKIEEKENEWETQYRILKEFSNRYRKRTV